MRKTELETMSAKTRTAMYEALARGGTRRAVFASVGLTLRTAQNYLKRGRDYRQAMEEGLKPEKRDKPFFDFLEKVETSEGKAETLLANEQFQMGIGELRTKIKIHVPLGNLNVIAERLGIGPRPPLSDPDGLIDWLERVAADPDAPDEISIDVEAWRQRDVRAGQFMLTRRYSSSGWGLKSLDVDPDQAEGDLAFI